ncbi:MAG: hypothetical protein AAGC60_02585 [Acidobacteriota bacterium]
MPLSNDSQPSSPEPRDERTPTQPADRLRDVLVVVRWPLVVLAVAVLGYLMWIDSLDRAERAARGLRDTAGGAVERAGELARGLLTSEVTERFMSALPTIDPSGSGRLEVAKAEIVETFTRSDDRRAFWDVVPLGRTTVEIEVPVTYRYHLRLEDAWTIEVRGQVARVHAPVLRPSQPPAIDTSRLRSRTEESWLRFDAGEQLDALQQSLTPRLRRRAASPGHIDLVRDEARRTVARFVREWLLGEGWWGDDGFTAVDVVFADEDGAGLPGDPELSSPVPGPSLRVDDAIEVESRP